LELLLPTNRNEIQPLAEEFLQGAQHQNYPAGSQPLQKPLAPLEQQLQ
jgi:hypothetical protein